MATKPDLYAGRNIYILNGDEEEIIVMQDELSISTQSNIVECYSIEHTDLLPSNLYSSTTQTISGSALMSIDTYHRILNYYMSRDIVSLSLCFESSNTESIKYFTAQFVSVSVDASNGEVVKISFKLIPTDLIN